MLSQPYKIPPKPPVTAAVVSLSPPKFTAVSRASFKLSVCRRDQIDAYKVSTTLMCTHKTGHNI